MLICTPKSQCLAAFIYCLLILVCSCKDDVYFTAHHHFEKSLWYSEHTIKNPIQQFLTYKGSKEQKEMQLNIGIRYTDKYKYRAIYIETQICDTTGQIGCDTLQFLFADKGENGFRFRKQTQPLRHFVPDSAQTYTLNITHIMKQNPLEGITDLTIGCEEIEE